jgi:hypothetical protein
MKLRHYWAVYNGVLPHPVSGAVMLFYSKKEAQHWASYCEEDGLTIKKINLERLKQ